MERSTGAGSGDVASPAGLVFVDARGVFDPPDVPVVDVPDVPDALVPLDAAASDVGLLAVGGWSCGLWLGMGVSLSRLDRRALPPSTSRPPRPGGGGSDQAASWPQRRAVIIGCVAEVLHVCLANQCRSPLAEVVMRHRLAERGLADQVTVSSAGIRARSGRPIWPPAGELARRRGLDVTGCAARMLTPAMVIEADLVLAATRALRDEVITLVPAAMRRTFTWRELAWLVDGVTPGSPAGDDAAARLRALPALAASRRGHRPPVAPEELDVVDPVDRDPQLLVLALAQIDTSVTAVVDLIAV